MTKGLRSGAMIATALLGTLPVATPSLADDRAAFTEVTRACCGPDTKGESKSRQDSTSNGKMKNGKKR